MGFGFEGLALTRVGLRGRDRFEADRLAGCDRERQRCRGRRVRGVLDPQLHVDHRRGLPTPFAFSLDVRIQSIRVPET